MRRSVLLLVLVLAGCGPSFTVPPDQCRDQATSERMFGLFDLGEYFDARAGDYATRSPTDAGVTLTISQRQYGGRLHLQLHEPLEGGELPRSVVTPEGCSLPDRLVWRDDVDGKLHSAAATLEVLDGGTGSGTVLDLRLTGARLVEADGTGKALPELRVTLPITGS